MRVTKSFKSGNSVAVRLPREMGVAAGTELEMEKEGDVIHLRPKSGTIDVSAFGEGAPGVAERWQAFLDSPEAEFQERELDWSEVIARFPAKP